MTANLSLTITDSIFQNSGSGNSQKSGAIILATMFPEKRINIIIQETIF